MVDHSFCVSAEVLNVKRFFRITRDRLNSFSDRSRSLSLLQSANYRYARARWRVQRVVICSSISFPMCERVWLSYHTRSNRKYKRQNALDLCLPSICDSFQVEVFANCFPQSRPLCERAFRSRFKPCAKRVRWSSWERSLTDLALSEAAQVRIILHSRALPNFPRTSPYMCLANYAMLLPSSTNRLFEIEKMQSAFY